VLERSTAGICFERAEEVADTVCSFDSFGRDVRAIEAASRESLGEAGRIERSV